MVMKVEDLVGGFLGATLSSKEARRMAGINLADQEAVSHGLLRLPGVGKKTLHLLERQLAWIRSLADSVDESSKIGRASCRERV